METIAQTNLSVGWGINLLLNKALWLDIASHVFSFGQI